jgi:hypothetical protein
MENYGMRDYNVEDIKQASESFHSGWNTFDMQNEGVRLFELEKIVSSVPFNEDAAVNVLAELTSLSRSFGYADADSYLHRTAGLSPEEIEEDPYHASERQALFEDHEENDFFAEYRTSFERLEAVASTDEAKEFLGTPARYGRAYRAIVSAFENGRDAKVGGNEPTAGISP